MTDKDSRETEQRPRHENMSRDRAWLETRLLDDRSLDVMWQSSPVPLPVTNRRHSSHYLFKFNYCSIAIDESANNELTDSSDKQFMRRFLLQLRGAITILAT